MSVELAKDLNAGKGFAALRAAKLSEYTDYCTIVKNIYIYIYIPLFVCLPPLPLGLWSTPSPQCDEMKGMASFLFLTHILDPTGFLHP